MKQLLLIFSLLLSAVFISACTSAKPDKTITEPYETPILSGTPTAAVTPDVPAPKETFSLSENSVADVLLGTNKVLTVTDSQLILTVSLGITETTVMNRANVSITMTDCISFKQVTISDNTGQTVTINLTDSDYEKVFGWFE